jgi:hypothetical protein
VVRAVQPQLHEEIIDEDGDVWPAGEDCDDQDPDVHPSALEICDGYDNDCDLAVDEGTPGMRTWYYDEDSDGYGAQELSLISCEQPPGYVLADGDCAPLDGDVYPGRPEICENGKDDDCDESTSPCGLERALDLSDAAASVLGIAGGSAFATASATGSNSTGPSWTFLADPTWQGTGAVWGLNHERLRGWMVDLTVDRLDSRLGTAGVGAELGAALAITVAPDGGSVPAVGAPGAMVQEAQEGVVYLMSELRDDGQVEVEARALLSGAAPGRRLGAALVDLGDADGDGAPELAVGAPGDLDGAGSVGIFGGPIESSMELGDARTWLRGQEGAPPVGAKLAAGDLDGDGLGDLVLSSPDAEAGQLWITFGPTPEGILGLADLEVQITGETAGDGLGAAMCAGDLDGDGTQDLIVGAPMAQSSAGAVYLFAGRQTLHARAGRLDVDSARGRLDGATAGDQAGSTVHAGEDLDGDGRVDLVVGAPGSSRSGGVDTGAGVPTRTGAVYLLTTAGSGNRSLSVADGTLLGDDGSAVGGPGVLVALPDADANGLAELLVASPTQGDGKAWIFKPKPE